MCFRQENWPKLLGNYKLAVTIVALETQSTRLQDLTLGIGSTLNLNPNELFDLSNVDGTLVELEFNAPVENPIIYVELYDDPRSATRATPITAENFLYYVNNGSYNFSIIHRSVPNFVVQGGGYRTPITEDDEPLSIETKEAILNEAGNSNIRGTLAMAKLGGDPNSATSQWFINTNDNSANLDSQNGGFTVFGEVLGTGMDLVDLIAQTEILNLSGLNPAFQELPVWTAEDEQQYFVVLSNARELADETSLMGFFIDSNKPEAINASINSVGEISIRLEQPLATPLDITLTATSLLDGSTATQNLTLNEIGSNNVYRFYNSNSSVHFYTPSKEEWLNVSNNPDWGYQYEGVAYQALSQNGIELFRFYNPAKGYHFMTTNTQEALNVIKQSAGENYDLESGIGIGSQTNGWGYTYEGRSYQVSTSASEEAQTAVYRFYKPSAGVHFYSSSLEEVRNVITQSNGAEFAEDLDAARTAPLLENGWGYRLEGVAWFAAGSA